MITQQEFDAAVSSPEVRQMAMACVQKMHNRHLEQYGAAAYNAIIESTIPERLTYPQYWAIVHFLSIPGDLDMPAERA